VLLPGGKAERPPRGPMSRGIGAKVWEAKRKLPKLKRSIEQISHENSTFKKKHQASSYLLVWNFIIVD